MKAIYSIFLAFIVGLASGQVLYASGWTQNNPPGNSPLYIIENPFSQPTAHIVGQMSRPITDLAINNVGQGYVISDEGNQGFLNDRLFAVDLQTATLSPVGVDLGLSNANGLEFDKQGNLFLIGYLDSNLYKVNLETGVAMHMATASRQFSGDLAVSPDGSKLYIASGSIMTIFDLNSGQFSDLALTGTDGDFVGLSFLGEILIGMTATENGIGQPSLFAIDTQNGIAESIGSISGSVGLGGNGLATSVPETSTTVILLFATILLAVKGIKS